MEKQITLRYNGIEFECLAKVPFSNCLCLEFKNTIPKISNTGYKCEYLGVTMQPFEAMQTIEVDCVDYIKQAYGIDVEVVKCGNIEYSKSDLELQRKWRDILSGKSDGFEVPKFQQLTLF